MFVPDEPEMDEKTLVVIAIGVVGAVLTQIAVIYVAYRSYKRERRTRRADEARGLLTAGGDALERFHWTIQEALESVTDKVPDSPVMPLNTKAWQKVVASLEKARVEASMQGTRIAIEFGMQTRVRAEYDDHQGFYRKVAEKLIGDRARDFRPTERTEALKLLEILKSADYDNAYITAASNASKARDKGRSPEAHSGNIYRLRKMAEMEAAPPKP